MVFCNSLNYLVFEACTINHFYRTPVLLFLVQNVFFKVISVHDLHRLRLHILFVKKEASHLHVYTSTVLVHVLHLTTQHQ